MFRSASLGWSLLVVAGLFALGCGGAADNKKGQGTGEPPLKGNTLTLGVLGDPPLAAEVTRLTAEWQARTGGELKVVELSAEEAAQGKLAADVVFVPTYAMGPLAEKGLLEPLPAPWRTAPQLAWDDFLEIPRLRESAWGESIHSVPLGSPGLVLFYRKDVLDEAGLEPPRTWAEYQKIAEQFAKKPGGSIEPLGKGWAGITLLARAASYARHKSNYSDLFDVESMRPLIDGPPFVTALEELVAAYRTGPAKQLDFDPVGVSGAFLTGQGTLALSWMPAGNVAMAPHSAPCAFAEVPGATRAFDLTQRTWQDRDGPQSVPLVSLNGRVGAVVKSSPHKGPALQLLLALTTGDWGARISRASSEPTASRRSQWDKPEGWLPRDLPAKAAAQYAAAAQKAAAQPMWMHALRIPGREAYLSALDDAVRAAVEGKEAPQAALTRAAGRWSEITAGLGKEAQRRAYQRSLGLEP
jgi:multiple sugar transport system substrate-binding protein